MKFAEFIQDVFMTDRFRVYTNHDVIGVELGGALKNIIALGAGISDGMGFGDNAKAAMMTRGIAEIARLGVQLGAEVLTFAGLAGLGDLVATCTSPLSRNRTFGARLGEGAGEDLAGSGEDGATDLDHAGVARVPQSVGDGLVGHGASFGGWRRAG